MFADSAMRLRHYLTNESRHLFQLFAFLGPLLFFGFLLFFGVLLLLLRLFGALTIGCGVCVGAAVRGRFGRVAAPVGAPVGGQSTVISTVAGVNPFGFPSNASYVNEDTPQKPAVGVKTNPPSVSIETKPVVAALTQ